MLSTIVFHHPDMVQLDPNPFFIIMYYTATFGGMVSCMVVSRAAANAAEVCEDWSPADVAYYRRVSRCSSHLSCAGPSLVTIMNILDPAFIMLEASRSYRGLCFVFALAVMAAINWTLLAYTGVAMDFEKVCRAMARLRRLISDVLTSKMERREARVQSGWELLDQYEKDTMEFL